MRHWTYASLPVVAPYEWHTLASIAAISSAVTQPLNATAAQATRSIDFMVRPLVCCSRCREPRRLPAWIAKGCKPPLTPWCANVCQSSAFCCHGVAGPISLPTPTPLVPDLRGQYRVLTGGGCRRERQG